MFEKMRKMEKGQALLEYVATFPAAIMVGIVVGAAMGPGLVNMYQRVVLTFEEEVVCETTTPPTKSYPGGHEIEVVDHNYDGAETTVTYRVKSTNNPSISHWVLGLSEDAYDDLISISEGNTEFGTDPTSGTTGLKFDTGYETASNIQNPTDIRMMSGTTLAFAPYNAPQQQLITDEREITMVFSGEYDLVEEKVSIKAGPNVYYETMAVPSKSSSSNGNGEGCE